MEDRYIYILNLTRYRIFLFSIVLVMLFSSIFALGLFVGIYSNDHKLASLGENKTKDMLNTEIYTETFDTLAGESPAPIARNSQNQTRLISSADLLAQDIKVKQIEKNETRYRTDKPVKRNMERPAEKKAPPQRQNTRIAPSGYQTKYFIQLLVSRDKKKVERIAERLLDKKLKGYVRISTLNAKTYYAVRVGLYTDKAKATRDLKRLRETFKDAYIKVNIPRKA